MCKVLMIAGIKRHHQEKIKKLSHEFLKAAADVDDDGFGYAAITSDGKIYGEKWLNKEDVFAIHSQPQPPPGNQLVKNLLGDAGKPLHEAPSEQVYDSFGVTRTKEVLQNTVAVIVHARKKTYGEKAIQNCHPFYASETKNDPATALIHNGSIMNHASLTKKTSTCDSEVILHEYLKEAMSYNPWAIPTLAKTLVGQYTVGVLTSTTLESDKVQPVLDIFKSARELHCAFIKELDTYVFCTLPGLLFKACKEAGLTCMGMSEVRDGYLIRLNAITGMRLEDIIPFEQSRQYLSGNTTVTDYERHGGGAHHRSGTHSRSNVRHLGPALNREANDDSVDFAKQEFEKKHRDLFHAPYYDMETGLTKEELEYYKELETNKTVDMKALRLVKKVLNF